LNELNYSFFVNIFVVKCFSHISLYTRNIRSIYTCIIRDIPMFNFRNLYLIICIWIYHSIDKIRYIFYVNSIEDIIQIVFKNNSLIIVIRRWFTLPLHLYPFVWFHIVIIIHTFMLTTLFYIKCIFTFRCLINTTPGE